MRRNPLNYRKIDFGTVEDGSEMGGIEATEIIRREISKELPIVALTAAAMKEDEEAVMASGMNGYLVKPVDVKKLKEALIKFGKKGGS